MKKAIYLLFLSVFLTLQGNSQNQVWHTDMAKASQISIEENKPLLMFFTGSDWCGWCKRLQREVFLTDEFKNWAKDNVVLVELDFPRRKQLDKKTQIQNYQLQNLFKVRGYPSVIFAKPEKKEGNKMNLNQIGSTGYVKGGTDKWLLTVNSFLKTKT
ncbi:thioredoxin family protein [Hyunsoonleella sp. 2307UL5-6]|uniref:thioredoxin family protein n=1 Tax=Hyunsoonleella sp. 2307UL5-6 TaxID=3384768 RepID=UPI0039BCD694